jgi:hypothetical protein
MSLVIAITTAITAQDTHQGCTKQHTRHKKKVTQVVTREDLNQMSSGDENGITF